MNETTNENTLSVKQRYQQTLGAIDKLSEKYHRSRDSIRVVAVSKRHTADKIIKLIKQGQVDFAENYLQEALDKIKKVDEYCKKSNAQNKTVWHFIGHIQSRKSREIAENFDWVHTVESIKVANKLNQYREAMPPLNVLIQLNLEQEASKSGVALDDLNALAGHIAPLSNLKLRGLMIIPKPESDFSKQRAIFRRCRSALDTLNQGGLNLGQLSMGMTADMEAAIAEGATQIRIGTAIFGSRPT